MTVRMKTDTTATPSRSRLIVSLPLCLLRSALFAAGRIPAAQHARRQVPIAPYRGASLRQTGPALGQHHALAWQAVLHWANDAGIEDDHPFAVPADDLLRVLGCQGGDSAQRQRMVRWLADLAATRIEYKTDLHAFDGPLLGQATTHPRTGRPVLRLPAGWQALTRIEILRNDLSRKRGMGSHSLALWLHDYIATQFRAPRECVETLRRWSGSGQDLAHFRHELRKALRRLAPKAAPLGPDASGPAAPAPGALVLGWHIDRHDRLHIEKAATGVHVADDRDTRPAMKVQRRQEIEVQRARMQRANVSL